MKTVPMRPSGNVPPGASQKRHHSPPVRAAYLALWILLVGIGMVGVFWFFRINMSGNEAIGFGRYAKSIQSSRNIRPDCLYDVKSIRGKCHFKADAHWESISSISQLASGDSVRAGVGAKLILVYQADEIAIGERKSLILP